MNRHRNQSFVRAVCALAFALIFGISSTYCGTIYFSDIFQPTFSDGLIKRVNDDGSGLQTVVNVGGGLRGMVVNAEAGHIYWSDVNNDVIRRADLDGSNQVDIITNNLAFPSPLGIDTANDQLYWSDNSLDQIGRSDLDGGNSTTIVSHDNYSGLAIDPINGKIYWTVAHSVAGSILRADLDGSNIETVSVNYPNANPHPGSLAVDPEDGKLYWTDRGHNTVNRANIDGTGFEELYVSPSLQLDPGAITLDLFNDRVYWAHEYSDSPSRMRIMRMDLDGSNDQIVTGGVGAITSMFFVSDAAAAVPEPGTMAFLGMGALAMAILKRRRN